MMFENAMGITKIGVIAATFLFITLLGFYVLSGPIDTIIDAFDDADMGHANDEMDEFMPVFKNILTLFWAIFLALPLTWIVIKVFGDRDTSFGGFKIK